MAPSPLSDAEDKLRRWAEAQARRDEIVCEAAAREPAAKRPDLRTHPTA